MKCSVIGLGYVGLPLAIRLTLIGHQVVGIDKNKQKIREFQKLKLPFAKNEPHLLNLFKKATHSRRLSFSTKYDSISKSDLVFINVDTPLKGIKPDNETLISACKSCGQNLKKGTTVVIESTIAPRTCVNIIIPVLENESKLKLNRDFYLAHVPERIRPNHIFEQLTKLQRVIGISSPKIKHLLKEVYSKITIGELDFTDLTTAEVAKTIENSYRDVNIALANELALVCEELGVDFWQVRKFVNKAPAYNLHLPGSGVGGHCIPKDPWLLISSVRRTETNLLKNSRHINDKMPSHIYSLLVKALEKKGLKKEKVTTVILGYSYVENSDDTRNSPSKKFASLLHENKIHFKIHDPLVPEYKKPEPYKLLKGANAMIVMVKHDNYQKLNLLKIANLMRTKIIIDGRNLIDSKKAKAAGFLYKGIGNV